jgi:ApaG protein
MFVAVTEGIRISVESRFEPQFSNPLAQQFAFSYEVTIENENDFSVQLLRRHWIIKAKGGGIREVEGPGVIGEQPILESGERHVYQSGSNLAVLNGSMSGTYLMKRTDTDSKFRVRIPEFTLRVPYKMN